MGAFIYELSNEQFNNPFMWAMVNSDSFIYLMEHYDTLDWDNLSFDKFIRSDGKLCYSIIVDNFVRINYTHYLQGHLGDNSRIDGRDVYDYRAYEVAYNKYVSRVTRMLSKKELPIFF